MANNDDIYAGVTSDNRGINTSYADPRIIGRWTPDNKKAALDTILELVELKGQDEEINTVNSFLRMIQLLETGQHPEGGELPTGWQANRNDLIEAMHDHNKLKFFVEDVEHVFRFTNPQHRINVARALNNHREAQREHRISGYDKRTEITGTATAVERALNNAYKAEEKKAKDRGASPTELDRLQGERLKLQIRRLQQARDESDHESSDAERKRRRDEAYAALKLSEARLLEIEDRMRRANEDPTLTEAE